MITGIEFMHAERFLQDPIFAKEYAQKRISSITGKTVSNIDFPLKKRIIKINSIISLDGFRICLSGKSGGAKLIATPFMVFSLSLEWQNYFKRLDKLDENINQKRKYSQVYIFDERFDKVTA